MKYDPTKEWCTNPVANLRFRFGDKLEGVDDETLYNRFQEWGMMGLPEDDVEFLDYLQTGG